MKIMLSLVLCFVTAFTVQAQTAKKTPVKKATAVKSTRIKKPANVRSAAKKAWSDSTVRVRIFTDSGNITVRLYDSTPLHRDNFKKLVEAKFYDSLLFHRVIKGFMIQGGDPLSKNAEPGQPLGSGGGDMAKIPAEIKQSLFHKKGVLAAARDGNPEKASSACQFYLVQGKRYSDADLDRLEKAMNRVFSQEERAAYRTTGGTPFLDQNYTVFGEVISGMDVIDKIASAPTAPGDRPIGDVRMRMEIVK